jgi:MtaA/CmuA family methyltransferase
MSKKQRLVELLRGNSEPVQGQLFHPILMHFAARFAGQTYSHFVQDYQVLVESNLLCLEQFGHDAVSLISDPYRETSAFGAIEDFPEDAVPQCKTKLLKTLEGVQRLRHPDVCACERTSDRIQGAKNYRSLLGDDVAIIGWIEGPLTESCDLAGVNEILLQTYTEPEFVSKLMQKCLAVAKDFARAQIEAGCDVMGVGDAICSQISLPMYRHMVLPLHRDLFDYIHILGAFVKLHICGDITHLLAGIRSSGADIVDIDWMVNPEQAHRSLGPQTCVCGNLDPVAVIEKQPEDEVFKLAKELVERKKDRKFIFSGDCEITVNTPTENLSVLRKAAV